MNVSARDSPFLLTGDTNARYAFEVDILKAKHFKKFSFVTYIFDVIYSQESSKSEFPVSS